MDTPRTDDPDLSAFPREYDWEGYVPCECTVCPEEVVEFPVGDDLYSLVSRKRIAEIRQQMDDLDLGPVDDLQERFQSEYGPHEASGLVFHELGECPGTKVGGKPGFTAKDGRQFEHPVTFSSWEFDSASFRRWVAAEDQRLLAPPGQPLTWHRLFQECDYRGLMKVLGMQLGRTQRAHVYLCRESDPWDVHTVIND